MVRREARHGPRDPTSRSRCTSRGRRHVASGTWPLAGSAAALRLMAAHRRRHPWWSTCLSPAHSIPYLSEIARASVASCPDAKPRRVGLPRRTRPASPSGPQVRVALQPARLFLLPSRPLRDPMLPPPATSILPLLHRRCAGRRHTGELNDRRAILCPSHCCRAPMWRDFASRRRRDPRDADAWLGRI